MSFFKVFNRGKYRSPQPTTPRSIYTFSGGSPITEDTAMKVSSFYSGVMYISTQIAKLPWNVKNKTNQIQYNDKVNQILNVAPNTEMNSFTFRLWMLQNLKVNEFIYFQIMDAPKLYYLR